MEATIDYHRGGLGVRADYAFSDATFQSPLLLNAPDNPGGRTKPAGPRQPGDQLPGVPRHRAVLSVEYMEAPGFSAATSKHLGATLVGDEANLRPRTEPYAIVNLAAPPGCSDR